MTAFESANIGGIQVGNRIFRSATHEGMALPGGRVSAEMTAMYRDLSEGGVGLIITGFMCFCATDNPSAQTITIGSDTAIPELKSLTDLVHAGGTGIVAQLNHVGSQLTSAPSQAVLAPSDVIDPVNGIKPEPFSAEQIQALIKAFGDAAERAKRAGFDGVQIHGAHGYLFSKFLSPVFNRRDDEYGGSIHNRGRIMVETLREIKKRCGEDYPVWIKLNASDFSRFDNDFEFDDLLVVAKALDANGIDAIELSGGTMAGAHNPCRSIKHEAYHLDYARQLTKAVEAAVILVGGFRKIELVEAVLSNTAVEAISMCRPLIREPGLVKRWADGDREKAACVACNGCFNPKRTRCFFQLEGEEQAAQKEVMKKMAAMRGNK